MLRAAETHVRVMAAAENFDFGEKNTITVRANNGNATFGPFTSIRRNSDESNKSFFDATIRKVAYSAVAGQSYTIIVMGPPSSGRSQTVYNVIKDDPGIVYLMAAELLKQQQRGSAVVDFCAYNVRGERLYDSITSQQCSMVDFGAPVGTVPMCTVRPLEDPAACVVIPSTKRAQTSCLFTFHVYAPLIAAAGPTASNRRDAFATITIVDLAGFDTTTPPDVQLLATAVRNRHVTMPGAREVTTGVTSPKIIKCGDGATSPDGSSFKVKQCALTHVLHEALTGGSQTLITVATLTGRPGSADFNVATLNLLQEMSGIQQIATLLQMAPPRWVGMIPTAAAEYQKRITEATASAYERGVADSFHQWVRFMKAKQRGEEETIESFGQDLTQSAQLMAAQVRSEVEHQGMAVTADQQRAQALQEGIVAVERECQDLIAKIDTVSNRTMHTTAEEAKLRSATELELENRERELSAALAHQQERQERMEEEERGAATAEARKRDYEKLMQRGLDMIHYDQSSANYEHTMGVLQAKRQLLEQQLCEASEHARVLNTWHQADRERKSLVQLAANLERQVEVKRSLIRSNSVAGADVAPPPTTATTSREGRSKRTRAETELEDQPPMPPRSRSARSRNPPSRAASAHTPTLDR